MIEFTSIFRILLVNSLTFLTEGNRRDICIFKTKLIGTIIVPCHTYII